MAFTAAALAFDVLEISHQLGADRIVLVTVAGAIAVLRVATLVRCGFLYRSHPVAT